MTDSIRYQLNESGIASVRIDRPAVRNAFDWDAWQALGDAFFSLAGASTRAVVLSGGSEWFSAGGDVSSMSEPGRRVTAPADRPRLAERAVRAITACPAPVIAAVEGYAIGAAWGLVLACDLVVASRTSYFAAPFLKRALVPDAGVAWALERRVGRHRAARLLLLGERLSAPEAMELGLVTHLTDAGQAEAVATELADVLAAGPADSVLLTKSLLRSAPGLSLDQFLDEEYLAIALNGHGADAAEGRRAFLEKRSPHFR